MDPVPKSGLKSGLNRPFKASQRRAGGKVPRPRGRPPRSTLGCEDADAVRSLRSKLDNLDDNIRKLNQIIESELVGRGSTSPSQDSSSDQESIITPTTSPTAVESEDDCHLREDSGKDPPWSYPCPVTQVNLSLRAIAPPIQDALVGRFVDSYGSPGMTTNETNHSIHDGRPWLLWRYGAEECAFSPLLKSAYSAVSTAYAGLSLNNKHFTRSAARTYSYVLKSLQKALNNPETGKSDAVLMTVGLCMNYEARLSRESKAGYSVHVTGVLKLFEYRGPSLQRSGLAHYFFVDTRLYCTWGAILSRRPTFLSDPEWKTIPWSLETTRKDLFQYLFDVMLDIPLMLWYYDKYQHSSETVERSALHKTASKIAKQIQAGLSTWKSEWLDRATWRRPHEQTLEQLDSDLPIFRYPNPNDPTQNIEPTPLVYPNGALFAVICNYNAALIIVHDTVRRLEGHEDFSLQISVAREICRSMSYFLMYLLPSRLGRIAFALVTAYDNLPVDGPEREYLADVYHSCAGGSWRRFDDFLQEFSVTPKA